LELVEVELQQVCGAVETNLVFVNFHKDPYVSKTVRVKAIVEIFKNIKFNDVMKNFLGMGLYLYRTNYFFLLSVSANILGCVFCAQGKVSYS
jgi:F0F1-type ATP synthase delta subunit